MVRYAEGMKFGTRIADWQERVNVERLRRERADKARAALRTHNVPAILVTRSENTRYLVGLRGPEFVPQLWYVLFFADHDPVVFHHAGWIQHYPAEAPWIKEWRLARAWLGAGPGAEASTEEAALFADGIHAELERHGLLGEPLGVVGFDAYAQRALGDKGIKTVDGWPIMLDATKTKTIDELYCLKIAYDASDAAWWRAWENLKPGAIDVEVSRKAMVAAWEAGAEEIPTGHFRSGPTSFDRAFEQTGRIFNYGDLAYGAFCGVRYMGYQTCYYRTFSIGCEPSRKATDWYRKLVDRLDRVIDAVKPGATTADAAACFEPAGYWGLKDEAELLTLEIGHGVGLHTYGYPIINRQWSLKHPQVFEVGMTLAVESREGEVGVGGVRLEDTIVVTEDGAELIDRWPRDRILVAPGPRA